MKFIMVVILCFGADCQAIFEQDTYQRYDLCMETAAVTRGYMMETYPMSSGAIYCMTEAEFEVFNNNLKQGDEPSLDNPALPKQKGISA